MRVLIVPDKFKGTLTAQQAAAALARGWRRARPADRIEALPMSDGGDGFGRVTSQLMGARRRSATVVDAAHRPRRASWWWDPQSRTAIIESAEVIGLALLPVGVFHPFALDTTGLGRLLAVVARRRPRHCFIGIGGSATNDGGFGMARALGWRFLDRSGKDLATWTDLAGCRSVVAPLHPPSLGRVTVAVDVENPLLGPTGCTRIYGPQKGLRPRDFSTAERALRQLARTGRLLRGKDLAAEKGAGAAGGLGFGLMTFLNARPASGFSLFANLGRLRERIRSADLVLTGEGALDKQSLMGKGVGRLAEACRRVGVPCIALSGVQAPDSGAASLLAGSWSLTPGFVSREEALGRPALHLARLAAQVAASKLWT